MKRLLNEIVREFVKDGGTRLAAALAYYSVLAIAPLIIISIAVAGLFLGTNAAFERVFGEVDNLAGEVVSSSVKGMISMAPYADLVSLSISVVVLAFGASGVFMQMKDCLNSAWYVSIKRGPVKHYILARIVSFSMVFICGSILIASVFMSFLVRDTVSYLNTTFPLFLGYWKGIHIAASLIITTILFSCIFRILPDRKIKMNYIFFGGFVTAALFNVGKFAIAFYISRISFTTLWLCRFYCRSIGVDLLFFPYICCWG